MKLKDLTDNKYSLSDIFIKHNEIILLTPLLLYLFYPFIHILVFTFCYSDELTFDDLSAYFGAGELPGDYKIPIIDLMFVMGAIVALFAIISFIIKQKKNPIKSQKSNYIPLCFFIMVCIFMIIATIANGGISTQMLCGFTVRGEGLLSIFIYFLVYYLCGSLIKNENYKYLAIYTYESMLLCVAIITLVDTYWYNIPIIDTTGICGIFYHFNFYGYVLTIGIMLSAPLFLTEKRKSGKIFAIFMLILNTVMLNLSNTFGCFVACLVAFIFMIVFASIKNKKFSYQSLIVFAIFIAVCLIMSIWYESFFTQLINLFSDIKAVAGDIVATAESSSSATASTGTAVADATTDAAEAGTARWGLWKQTIKYIIKKPIFGYGFEGTCDQLMTDCGQDKVHNEYLNWAADFGIPTAIMYIGGLTSIFIKALKKRKSVDGATFCCLCGAMGYMVSAFFGNEFIFTIPFFFIFLGLSNGIFENNENTELTDVLTEITEKTEIIQ